MTIPAPLVASLDETKTEQTSWGTIMWLVSGEAFPDAEQTFGVVTIAPGSANPLHQHPNCEEILYVVSGTCEHRVGDTRVTLSPGEAICIPRGTPHCARTTSNVDLVVVVSFSSSTRQVVNLEEHGVA